MVLPVPVLAWASMSLPCKLAGMVWAWTGVMVVIFMSCMMVWRRAGSKPLRLAKGTPSLGDGDRALASVRGAVDTAAAAAAEDDEADAKPADCAAAAAWGLLVWLGVLAQRGRPWLLWPPRKGLRRLREGPWLDEGMGWLEDDMVVSSVEDARDCCGVDAARTDKRLEARRNDDCGKQRPI